MVSNFGGDGGDVLVDPADGCNIVQEYVYLSMRVTKTCANPGPGHPNAFLDLSHATTIEISPPDVNAQFIAPFTANDKNINQWLAGGHEPLVPGQGLRHHVAARSGRRCTRCRRPTRRSPRSRTRATGVRDVVRPVLEQPRAVRPRRGRRQRSPAARGRSRRSRSPADFPNRYLQGAAIDPKDENHLFVGVNGFSRRFTEGPGAGIGHIFESTDGGADLDGHLGELPGHPGQRRRLAAERRSRRRRPTSASSTARRPRPTWQRLGSTLPVTVAMDLTLGPDGNIYAATHGRGIWRITAAGL